MTAGRLSYELLARVVPVPEHRRVISFEIAEEESSGVQISFVDEGTGAFAKVEGPSTRPPRLADLEDTRALQNPDDIVAPRSVQLLVTYPMRHGARFSIASSAAGGFSRAELLTRACEAYAFVYAEERRTQGREHQTVTVGGNVTSGNGVFHIWGHPLEHLVLPVAYLAPDADGRPTVWLEVQS